MQQRVLLTIMLLIMTVLLRFSLRQMIFRWNIKSHEMRRRWTIMVRRVLALIFFLGLILIWASSIRAAALTLAAVALAIVNATKELIMCLMGSVLKSSTRAFHMGDRIQVGDISGDVVDQSLLSTTLLEVGPGGSVHQYTGRVVTLPNSLFLNHAVKNESLGEKYSVHTFKVVIPRNEDWQRASDILLEVCRQETKGIMQEARRALEILTVYRNYNYINVDPRVSIDMSQDTTVDLIARIPCLVQERSDVEQRIIRKYGEKLSRAV